MESRLFWIVAFKLFVWEQLQNIKLPNNLQQNAHQVKTA